MPNPMLPDVRIGPVSDETRAGVVALMAEVCTGRREVRGNAGAQCALVAVQYGEVIGAVTWTQDETIGVVTGVGVRPDRRRFGVALAMVCALVDRLRDDGLTLLEARVGEDLPGLYRLFERAGFREAARDRGADGIAVHFERYLRGRRSRKQHG